MCACDFNFVCSRCDRTERHRPDYFDQPDTPDPYNDQPPEVSPAEFVSEP